MLIIIVFFVREIKRDFAMISLVSKVVFYHSFLALLCSSLNISSPSLNFLLCLFSPVWRWLKVTLGLKGRLMARSPCAGLFHLHTVSLPYQWTLKIPGRRWKLGSSSGFVHYCRTHWLGPKSGSTFALDGPGSARLVSELCSSLW